jgi:hypothetical protein
LGGEELVHVRDDAPQNVVDLVVHGWFEADEAEPIARVGGLLDEDAVGDEGVKVRRQLERGPKPLHERDRAARAGARDRQAKRPSTATLEREECAHEHRQGRGKQACVPRQREPDAVGKRQHPLPHGNPRDDRVPSRRAASAPAKVRRLITPLANP